jgi:hypothetical protein
MWHVMVTHEPWFHVPQWFRRRAGRTAAANIFQNVTDFIRMDVRGNIVHIDDGLKGR